MVQKEKRRAVVVGALVTILTAVAVELLNHTLLEGSHPAILILVPVAYAAFTGGFSSGLTSSAISIVAFVYIFLTPPGGHAIEIGDIEHLILLAVISPLMAASIGAMKNRSDTDRLAIEQSREAYISIFESVQDVYYGADSQGRITMLSPSIKNILGYEVEEMLGRPAADFYAHPSDRQLLAQMLEQHGQVKDHEIKLRKKNGDVIDAAITSHWTRFDSGEPTGVEGVLRDITQRKRAEEALRDRMEFEQTVAAISSRFVAFDDFDEAIRSSLEEIGLVSHAGRAYLFLSDADGTMSNVYEWCAEGVRPHRNELQNIPFGAVFPWWSRKIENGETILVPDVDALPPEATEEKVEFIRENIKAILGLPVYIDGVLAGFIGLDNVLIAAPWRNLDISLLKVAADIIGNALARQRNSDVIKAERDRTRLYFDSVEVMMVVLDAGGTVTRINPKGCEVLGYSLDEIIGRNWFEDFLPDSVKAEVLDAFKKLAVSRPEAPNELEYYENPVVTKDGRERLIAWRNSFLRDPAGNIAGTISSGQDITEQKMTEEYIKQAAFHDMLTGLPNRSLFEDRLEQALAHARRKMEMVAVFYLDLDEFKEINDSLGHDVGDLVLKAVAGKLAGRLRKYDTVSRFGGDEFLTILTEARNEADIRRVADSIVSELAQPIKVGGRDIDARASIGISIFPTDADQPAELIRQADVAMYRAKTAGGNRYRLFSERVEGTAA